MKYLLQTILILLLCMVAPAVYAQVLTQNIKGKIFDNESQSSLPGANVVVVGTSPLLGATTDADGNYKIANVPIGRYDIKVSLVGFDPIVIPQVYISSGKEVFLNTGLKQTINLMKEVTVKSFSRKDQPINSMATVSARSFTVEETRRYAGGMDDPARMASAFAGVTVGNIQDNAIIIRGNAPQGVSWRLEGVEIPNPNHFAGGNVAGGGFTTIFSSQMLANSDFFTGAFPAEYGNALAGVFDMKLRNGNGEKRESTVQIGIMGVDVSSEGPFKKGSKATYLFNYRYSTLALLSGIGLIPSEQIPKYQDLSFKLNFPTQRAGVFSLWGIGGLDHNIEPEEKDSTKWTSDWDRTKYDWKLNMGAAGLSHKTTLGTQTYISSTFALSGTQNIYDQQRFDNNLTLRKSSYIEDNSGRATLSTALNHKFSPVLTLRTGMNYHRLYYRLDVNSTTVDEDPSTYQNIVKSKGNTGFTEFFTEAKYNLTSSLSVDGGFHLSQFELNNDFSVDPRMGLRWEVSEGHALSFGYGKHSRLEDLKIYLVGMNVNGKMEYPNKNLALTQAQHFVLGYDWLINDNLRLKIEPYFQYLYNVPGIADSSYSMINFKQDWTFYDSLSNNSIGRNYGVDFTLERFLNNNYYYLVTASVFDSKYKASDGVWRNTRYNKGYSVNLLMGKEFYLKNNKVLGINGRFNYIGGERTSPLLAERSLQEKKVYYDETKAFEAQESPTYYLDLTITYRINKRKYSGVWALQVKNILGSPMEEGYYYDYQTRKIEKGSSSVVLPVLSYKVEF
jgi:hypothetical protein